MEHAERAGPTYSGMASCSFRCFSPLSILKDGIFVANTYHSSAYVARRSHHADELPT
jgi:hypothetical protein